MSGFHGVGRVTRWLLAVLLVSAVSCAEGPTAPAAPAGEASAVRSLAAGGTLELRTRTSADRADLEGALRAEWARIEAEKVREAALGPRVQGLQPLRGVAGTLTSALGLLQCVPLPWDAGAAIIGPRGGSLKVGPHRIDIPRGALRQYVLVTAEIPRTSLVGIDLEPHGLTFTRSAELVLSYEHCNARRDQDHWIVYLDPFNNILEWPFSRDDRRRDEVTADIDHFSRYAVVAN